MEQAQNMRPDQQIQDRGAFGATLNVSGLEGAPYFTSCTRHIDKKVEYFCKTCSDTVCARCIFDEHNGHELV